MSCHRWYHHHFVKIGLDCEIVQSSPHNHGLYIRSDRKEKSWIQNSWWIRATPSPPRGQVWSQRRIFICISWHIFSIACRLHAKIMICCHIWSSYYSLLGPSSVWSESSLSRTKNSEFESSIEYSQGPDHNRAENYSLWQEPTFREQIQWRLT